MAQAVSVRALNEILHWPSQGLTRVPMQVYSSPEIYAWEQDKIFRGATWNFVGLEIEAPNPNDYFTSLIGETPVIVVRTADGKINVMVNRCAHKGATVCFNPSGNAKFFTCPYHNWIYDHSGQLTSVAFEKGVNRLGGMPPDFKKSDHRLQPLRVEIISGLIFATFSDKTPSLEEFLGPVMTSHIKRTIYGKPKMLGRYRQLLQNNWKLYAENGRDNYHPSLLHAFFATFKLNRLSAEGGVRQDESGWHHMMFAKKQTDAGDAEYSSGKIRAQKEGYYLEDPSLIDQWMEFDDSVTNAIQCLFPGFVLQQILNCLGTRQINPLGVDKSEIVWTLFGFEHDTEEQTELRLKQSNLVGPSGLVSLEDGAIGNFVLKGIKGDVDAEAVLMMGGSDVASGPSRATETGVRSFWKAYRELMDV
jgi:phenylpropionate dioxygenase-like ring-hydroxylating dioxygenase large terminal subunit